MPGRSTLHLTFPAGGVDKRLSYNQQRPFTTPSAMNVRPDETLEGRERGGSRPGISKWAYESLGAAVRMLAPVDVVASSTFDWWSDSFDEDSILGVWSAPGWAGSSPALLPGDTASVAYATGKVGLVRTALADFDTSSAYAVQTYVAPWLGDHWADYYIYLRMDDTTPVATTDGVVVRLNLEGGDYSGSVIEYASGTPTASALTSGSVTGAQAGWFTCLVTGSTLKVYWLGTLLGTVSLGAAAGTRFGFGMEAVRAGGIALVDEFRVQYHHATAIEETRTILVASADGSIWYEDRLNEMAELSATPELASDRYLQAHQLLQKLYIADFADVVAAGTDGVVSGSTLDAASYSDWSTLGIDTDDHIVFIYDPTGPTAGVYTIASVAAGAITLGSAPGDGSCSYRIERAVKVYDHKAGTLANLTPTAGYVPAGCRCLAVYQERLILAGPPNAPHLFFASALSDPTDWDYSATGAGRAVSGAPGQSAGLGSVGQPIRAAIAHADDLLVFGCTSTLWVLRGNPADYGRWDTLSREVGILDRGAWCHGPDGELVFMDRGGLYALDAQASGPPVRLSGERLPRDLRNIDPRLYDVLLAWDHQAYGVHIFVTPVDASSNGTHWWFDWEAKSFWPQQLGAAGLQPTAIAQYKGDVVLGTSNYIRRFDEQAPSDEGTAIASHVDLGPFRLANDLYRDGIWLKIMGELGELSGDVTWAVRTGKTAQAAQSATAKATGTWSAGRSRWSHPQLRGGAAVLRLSSTARWSMEAVVGVFVQLGEQRP